MKAEKYEMKSLIYGVCKCQKCVENPIQTQFKPNSNQLFDKHHDIFLGGGGKKFTPPYRILIYAPALDRTFFMEKEDFSQMMFIHTLPDQKFNP